MRQKFDIEKYPKTFAYVLEYDTLNRRCNCCNSVVLKQPHLVTSRNPWLGVQRDLEEKLGFSYPYQCMACDRDLFEIETHLGEDHSDEELDMLCQLSEILQLDKD